MKKTITPEMAQEILDRNTINRTINGTNLAFYKHLIENGKFKYNGESIIISLEGNLMNGQHRLQACIDTGIPITVNIVDDVPEDAMPTLDSGRLRSGGDVLSMSGIKNANVTSAAIRLIIENMRKGYNIYDGKKLKVSSQEILEFYMEHGSIIEKLHAFASHLYGRGTKILTPTYIIAIIYIYSKSNDSRIPIDFMREVMLGIRIRKSNLARLLREKLINTMIGNTMIKERTKIDYILKALNFYIKDESRRFIRIANDEQIRLKKIDLTESPIIDEEYLQIHSCV